MRGIRNPHGIKFACTQETCEFNRITAVCLYMLTWLAWDHARSNNAAELAGRSDLAIQGIATTSGLVTEMKRAAGLCQALDQFVHACGRVFDRAVRSYLAVSPLFRDGNRDGFFVRIEADVQCAHGHLLI